MGNPTPLAGSCYSLDAARRSSGFAAGNAAAAFRTSSVSSVFKEPRHHGAYHRPLTRSPPPFLPTRTRRLPGRNFGEAGTSNGVSGCSWLPSPNEAPRTHVTSAALAATYGQVKGMVGSPSRSLWPSSARAVFPQSALPESIGGRATGADSILDHSSPPRRGSPEAVRGPRDDPAKRGGKPSAGAARRSPCAPAGLDASTKTGPTCPIQWNRRTNANDLSKSGDRRVKA